MKAEGDTTSVELAQSTLELATQQEGVEIFGEIYYALGVEVGNQIGRCYI